MPIDKNEFFRKATLIITGSLDINTAMHELADYLKAILPIDGIVLALYDPALNMGRILASTSPQERLVSGKMVPLPEAFHGFLLKSWTSRSWIRVVNNVETDDLQWRELLFDQIGSEFSYAVMDLKLENERLGSLFIFAKGKRQYTQIHTSLIALLHDQITIAVQNFLKHEEIIRLKDMLADANRHMQRQLTEMEKTPIIGADFGLKHIMTLVLQVGPLDSPVLLLGETGVGKELIASAIHYASGRADNPFVKINCGAIPENLIDSELFGHEKGAFTGALSSKQGRFERAHTGTLLLDEIGELPLSAQARLLRVLQDFEIERVGGTKAVPVDVRIISATNKDLEQMVRDGTFREDLWFRLNVVPIAIPPLRQRIGDIPALVSHFVEQKSIRMKIGSKPVLAISAMEPLLKYDWPGNVRELENVVERALIDHQFNPEGEDLTFGNVLPGNQPAAYRNTAPEDETLRSLDDVIAAHIRRVMAHTGGKVGGKNGSAHILGVHPNTLRARMNKLGVSYGRSQSIK